MWARRGLKRKHHTEEQIAAIYGKLESVSRSPIWSANMALLKASYYRWKAKYGGTDVSDAKRVKQMAEEKDV
jgi:putative transposase